jgi:(S)-2-hydroxyglutarate dehydrogenase
LARSYAPGSLKARFCREGNAATLAFSHEHGVPVEQCGKLIVATNDVEVSRLDLDGTALRRAEPRIVGKSAMALSSRMSGGSTRRNGPTAPATRLSAPGSWQTGSCGCVGWTIVLHDRRHRRQMGIEPLQWRSL